MNSYLVYLERRDCTSRLGWKNDIGREKRRWIENCACAPREGRKPRPGNSAGMAREFRATFPATEGSHSLRPSRPLRPLRHFRPLRPLWLLRPFGQLRPLRPQMANTVYLPFLRKKKPLYIMPAVRGICDYYDLLDNCDPCDHKWLIRPTFRFLEKRNRSTLCQPFGEFVTITTFWTTATLATTNG